ncbi:MAG TPA: MFS transporter [Bacilli bacterium]|jgi:MFS family permease|nr:MFS transporter [Acholeplasmataceae bacterium]HNZ77633.1 MFS transporter [Bacilli bacterium]HOD60480.1 MFS transporter [Bacilli bacterium]HOH61919.1 MFS transporter [Bacilli bacterium]HPM14619.1 MFS transporter [Bacilli bacterium]
MKKKTTLSVKNWILIWSLGMAGQLCWNIENQWFNTFVYAKIAPDQSIITWMVAVSAIVTTISTFIFGTLSDRIGSRKPFVAYGYILWGIFTIIFGLTMYIPNSLNNALMVMAVAVVAADALMSFFGSMGNDSGFNAWITDNLNDQNRGSIGAALAIQPVLGTIVGTVVGGIIIDLFGYMAFFTVMGLIVIAIGILSIFIMKDAEDLKANKEGSFWQQFAKAFNFKEFFKKKELIAVNVTVAIFFIAFNVYFVHIGNLFIYNYGFTAGDAGVIQGIGLIIALLFTIPAINLINKNKSPLLLAFAVLVDIIGLVILFLFAADSNPAALISVNNIPLFIGIILVGLGYVLLMQTTMVWCKKLYPETARGQFEGIRIIFFVLIPMVFGPMIADPIIEKYGFDCLINYGTDTDPAFLAGKAPTEILFLVSAILVVFTFIPLFIARKHHNERVLSEEMNVSNKE